MDKKKIAVINGPNLNLLGSREPDIYGNVTLKQINDELSKMAKKNKVEIEFHQSNQEGEIVEIIQKFDKDVGCIIINPAAYTHTSVAIRDAFSAMKIPVIEVHLSNIHAREDFRKHSYIAPVAEGQISGFGPYSYILALHAALRTVKKK